MFCLGCKIPSTLSMHDCTCALEGKIDGQNASSDSCGISSGSEDVREMTEPPQDHVGCLAKWSRWLASAGKAKPPRTSQSLPR